MCKQHASSTCTIMPCMRLSTSEYARACKSMRAMYVSMYLFMYKHTYIHTYIHNVRRSMTRSSHLNDATCVVNRYLMSMVRSAFKTWLRACQVQRHYQSALCLSKARRERLLRARCVPHLALELRLGRTIAATFWNFERVSDFSNKVCWLNGCRKFQNPQS